MILVPDQARYYICIWNTNRSKKRKHQKWISSKTLMEIGKRKQLKKAKAGAQKQTDFNAFNKANKEGKKNVRRDKRNFISKLATEAEVAVRQAQQHQSSVWQYKASYYKTAETSWLFKIEGNTPIPLRNNCLDGKKTFKSLLTNQHQRKNKDTANTFFTTVTSIKNYQAITGIKKVIPFLKQETSKAQGQDNIHTKALYTDGDTQPSCYNDLFAKIWEEEEEPLEWN